MATELAEMTILVEVPEPPKVKLIESDGEPMETDWHRRAMNVLIDSVDYHRRGREDYYVGGNMFIYFCEKQARDRDFRGPDFFCVDGVPRRPMRPYWVVWEEGGRYPDVVIELLSPSTKKEDETTKKRIYEKTFRTSQLYHYDPDNQKLKGWRLSNGKYQALKADKNGRLWCETLGLWLGVWNGTISEWEKTWLRFFDADGNLVPTGEEAERDRADEEKKRADALKKELDDLKKQSKKKTDKSNKKRKKNDSE